MMGSVRLVAVTFDLDRTLVQTERLRARSYARAAVELWPWAISGDEILAVHKDLAGLLRREVASMLVDRFDLEEKARDRMDEPGVEAPGRPSSRCGWPTMRR